MPRGAARGLSLIELTVGLAILSVVASMALPSYQGQLAKARRAEAMNRLTRLQLAQEQFRAHHGSYALRLEALGPLGEITPHIELSLASAHAQGYIARARITRETPQNGGCHELTLSVSDGQASQGPSDHCWNR
ncbi:MAG: prepilin-type N-terminal cleavage/methylation domain-containing protein [Rubrivivax sp.]|nr:prepilin-type N-terminal cleavage/methylation domain-containing protein [Rubrivivax sp.]